MTVTGSRRRPVHLVHLLSMVNSYLDSNCLQSVSPQVHKRVTRKFRKLLLFIDMATQYYSSVIIRKHLEENKNAISINYLPKGSPDYNAAEEGWKQGKEG